MFISKKRFNEELEKAKRETAEEVFRQREAEEQNRRMWDEFESIRRELYKDVDKINHRLGILEKAVLQPIEIKGTEGVSIYGKPELK